MFKKMMIARNSYLNEKAIKQMKSAGVSMPKEVEEQAILDAEEAELQKAIAESKALAEEKTNNTKADEAIVKKQE